MTHTKLLLWLAKPFRLDVLDKWLRKPLIKILDVGCGDHSSTKTKKYFPKCKYYGLDKSKDHNNISEDFEIMEKFYEIDLNNINLLKNIPNNYFDCIILSHIIEHIKKGEDIVLGLVDKLKAGGVMYLEFPSPRSLYLPRMSGTLNFYDDPTHIRLYTLDELCNLLSKKRFSIYRAGTRRYWKRILLFPIYLIISIIKSGRLDGSVISDMVGFASYLIAIKQDNGGKIFDRYKIEKNNLKWKYYLFSLL